MDNSSDFNRKLAFMVASMVTYWAVVSYMLNKRSPVSFSVSERNRDRMKYLEKLYCGQQPDCINLLRMSKHVFFNLCTKFCSTGHEKKNSDINFVCYWKLGPEMLRHRSTHVPSKIRNNSRFFPYFKDCIGAIDGTHIPCNVPARIADRFRGRKPFRIQNVLRAVDFDLMFTYVSAGWEGSAHDATVVRHSLDQPNSLRVPEEEMASNSVTWQPQVVKDLLLYFKEKIQESGKSLVPREVHHADCARRLNEKYATNFRGKQVYNKYHKLKGEWKVILEAKSASGASFDDVQKKIIHDEVEVVKMKSKGDKKAKYYNVPIPFYAEMQFVFTDKHATGEFCVLEAPFDHPPRHDDLTGNGKATQEQVDVVPSQHYDSDTLPESDSPRSVGSKRHPEDKKDKKGKRAKHGYAMVQDVATAMNNISETMRFTHFTDPNERIYKIIDDMHEYDLLVRLDLQTHLAQNPHIASMLKGRPMESIKQWVARWVKDRLNNMSETMRFTHFSDPNERIYKIIDDMHEYDLLVRLDLQTYLAQNPHIASMLKGRPMESIKQWVARWVMDRHPTN
ncbi:hypothetical protein ACP70R_017978 [Stipagrostis hirtigluma subsp. patula]